MSANFSKSQTLKIKMKILATYVRFYINVIERVKLPSLFQFKYTRTI